MNRRDFLHVASITSLAWLFPGTRAWAFSNGKDDPSSKKLIVILLRGGMDGLNVVVPYSDNRYYSLRPTIAIARPGAENGLIDLDGHFGLHPALQPLMPLWQSGSLAFVHSSGSPDQTRSHFDAQDYMESGVPGNKTIGSGWLNRLVAELPPSQSALKAISIGAVLPRMCSGPANIATVAASGPGGCHVDGTEDCQQRSADATQFRPIRQTAFAVIPQIAFHAGCIHGPGRLGYARQ
jgi:uncharacterized protein (DUF1501 family)